MTDRLTTSQHTAWLLCAMIAPVVHAASNCSWLVTLAISALCLAVWTGLAAYGVGENQGRLIGGIQWLWMLLVISEYLHWPMFYWPSYRSYHVLPLTVLLLAAWSTGKGAEVSARAGGVLLWFMIALVGAVAVSAISEVRLQNLKPSWELQTAHLIQVMLIPVMGIGVGKSKKKWRLGIMAIAASGITAGVLSRTLIYQMNAPFYEMSRGLTLLGIGQRFESLVAAGMTLGFYVLLTYLLAIGAKAWEPGKNHARSVWVTTLLSAAVFLSGMRLNSRLLAIGTMVVWVVFPILKKLVKNKNNA